MQAIEADAARAYLTSPEHAFCAALPVRDTLEHEACLKNGASFIVAQGDAPLGFILMLPVDGRAHVLETAVLHNRQRQGIGRTLFTAAENWPSRPEAAILAKLKNVVGTRRLWLTAELAGNDAPLR